jgi:hypothetical protein
MRLSELLSFSHEDFSLLTWNNPLRLMHDFPDLDSVQDGHRGFVLTRRASLWYALLCSREAEQDARRALASGLLHTPHLHALALAIVSNVLLPNDPEESQSYWAQHRAVLWRHGLVNTDIGLHAILNRLLHREKISNGDGLVRAAEDLVSRIPYEKDELRAARSMLLEYRKLSWLLAQDRTASLAGLQEFIARAERKNQAIFTALGHQTLSTMYREGSLYSPSLIHSSIAATIWKSVGRPDRHAETVLNQAFVLKNLGQTAQAEQLVEGIKDTGVGSRRDFVESQRLALLSDIREYQGDHRAALDLLVESARTVPGRLPDQPTAPITNWLSAGIKAREIGDRATAELVGQEIGSAVAELLADEPWTDFARLLHAGFLRDTAEFERRTALIRRTWPDFTSPDGASTTESLIETARYLLGPDDQSVESLDEDVDEYWQHLNQVSGEQRPGAQPYPQPVEPVWTDPGPPVRTGRTCQVRRSVRAIPGIRPAYDGTGRAA